MAEQNNILLYFVGTAGAGKSSLAGAYKEWCHNRGLDTVLVNLDPGADRLPYTPDVDVREWIDLRQIMRGQGLGPNGAQIAASDLLALNAERLRNAIEAYKTPYVLLDTPGQIELFVFRQSGRLLTQFLDAPSSLVAFLVDPFLAKTPSGFVSQLLLATSVHFRLGLPTAHVLTKTDLLLDDDRDRILQWTQGVDELELAFQQEEEGLYREMSLDLLRTLDGLGSLPKLYPTSAINLEGLDDLYTHVQQIMAGGEDLLAD